MKSLLYSASFTILLTLASCYIGNGQLGIRGEGPIVERKFDLDKITGISLPGSAKVFLTQGSVQEVRVLGQENIIENLKLEVQDGVWKVENKRSVWQSESVKIYITLESLKLIKISGSSDVDMENHFTDLKDLEIRISGSGKMDLDLDARDINASISGSGDLFMKGSAENLDFVITGSGNINAYDLAGQRAEVRITGSGGMELSVEDRLDAHISGSGSVLYKGDPKLHSSVSGSGSIRAR